MTIDQGIIQRIREIEDREMPATPGPWVVYRTPDRETNRYVQQKRRGNQRKSSGVSICAINGPCVMVPRPQPEANGEFMAHARADIPWLCEQLRKALGQ